MPLSAAKWVAARSFYDNLTLAQHGDEVERWAVENHPDLFAKFQHYEQFWRYHVCPATERRRGKEEAVGFRVDTHDIISVICQRSYSVFRNLVLAAEELRQIKTTGFGRFRSRADVMIKMAGDALQVATELQYAVEGGERENDFFGMKHLKEQLSATISIFPDWKTNFAAPRAEVARYRNYLTHQGVMLAVYNPATTKLMVLRQAKYSRRVFTWTQAERDFRNNPSDWLDLVAACEEVLHDAVGFLDLFYERLFKNMSSLLENPDYQWLWGWQDNVDPLAAPTGGRIPGRLGSSASSGSPVMPMTYASGTPVIPMTDASASGVLDIGSMSLPSVVVPPLSEIIPPTVPVIPAPPPPLRQRRDHLVQQRKTVTFTATKGADVTHRRLLGVES